MYQDACYQVAWVFYVISAYIDAQVVLFFAPLEVFSGTLKVSVLVTRAVK